VLVVGGAGFIGSRLVARCLDEGATVHVIDNLLSSERDNLAPHDRLSFREGSIADDDVLAMVTDEWDVVFHLATYHGNQSSIADPLADHANNLITTLKLFQRLSAFRRLHRVVYASTGCALAPKGDGPAMPVMEDGPIALDFDSPYQISKVAGEMYAMYFHQRHRLPIVRARFQNVYGPGEVLGAGRWRGTPATVWRNVVPTFVYRALTRQPLEVHGDGTSTRDFIFVDDIVDGLLRAAATPGVEGDVFNLASGVETAIGDLAREVLAAAGSPEAPRFVAARDWDRSLHRVGSTGKAARTLQFRASVDLRTGLARTVTWTRQHLPRIERVMARHDAHMMAMDRP
jgi:nucleoside-diphosphate-sugar epimerase